MTAAAPAGSAAAPGRFACLEICRAVAAPLVVYSHFVALWMADNHISSPTVTVVDNIIREPLQLQQELGHLAVVVFFLVSGFIITHTAVRERHREFAAKRLLRVYPALVVAVLLSAVLTVVGFPPLNTGQDTTVTPFTVLTNATLVNYVLVPQVVLVGVAWTLIIEMIFYAGTFLLLPLLRRAVGITILAELVAVAVVVLIAREAGTSFFLFAVSVSYLPPVLLGQTIWAVWSRRIPLWAGGLLGAAAWVLYVWAGGRDMGRLDDAYELTLLIGFLLFVIGILAEARLRLTRPIAVLADRSYAIYLMHGIIAFPVMNALYPVLPAAAAMLAGIVATGGAVELVHRLVERPSQRLARRLVRRSRPASTGQPGPVETASADRLSSQLRGDPVEDRVAQNAR